jgi:UDP-N-acetylglucosamine--dolichyl-phosphate N-acetylglucosaminephosphotransferase
MDYLLLIAIIVSLVSTLIFLPRWIKKTRDIDLTWKDMNKFGYPKTVSASGGIIVVFSFAISVLIYIGLKTFIYNPSPYQVEIFAILAVILFYALIGLTDDLLGWKHGGLSIKSRIFLAILASVPLAVINAGNSSVSIPFFGSINLGIYFPLVIVPLAVAFVSTTYNFLAGFNGLEAGLGIMLLSFASFVAYITGSPWLSIIGLCMIVSLLVFLLFNWSPAKVFPGDVLTYAIGALFISMAILGNFERIAIIVFIPYLIEMFLKIIRGHGNKYSFGKPNKDGTLEAPYKKTYGLTHFSIKFLKKINSPATEKRVVFLIYIIQLILILVAVIYLMLLGGLL